MNEWMNSSDLNSCWFFFYLTSCVTLRILLSIVLSSEWSIWLRRETCFPTIGFFSFFLNCSVCNVVFFVWPFRLRVHRKYISSVSSIFKDICYDWLIDCSIWRLSSVIDCNCNLHIVKWIVRMYCKQRKKSQVLYSIQYRYYYRWWFVAFSYAFSSQISWISLSLCLVG